MHRLESHWLREVVSLSKSDGLEIGQRCKLKLLILSSNYQQIICEAFDEEFKFIFLTLQLGEIYMIF